MSGTNQRRRNLLKAGMASLAASVASRVSAQQVSSQAPLLPPPEAKVLDSKEYGQRRIRRIQEALKRSGLDALIVSNRAID